MSWDFDSWDAGTTAGNGFGQVLENGKVEMDVEALSLELCEAVVDGLEGAGDKG